MVHTHTHAHCTHTWHMHSAYTDYVPLLNFINIIAIDHESGAPCPWTINIRTYKIQYYS